MADDREPTPPTPVRSPATAGPLSVGARVLVAALLVLFVGLSLHASTRKSEAYDEPFTLLAGWSYVVTGDLSFNREHPPLAKWLMGLSLLAVSPELPAHYQNLPVPAWVFLAEQPALTPAQLLFWGRLPGALLGIVLLLYVLRWARVAFGDRAGLLALALAATNPNLLALSRVAGNDFASATFGIAAAYHLWRWLETGRRGSLALGAVTLGLALGSKLTSLMLLPPLGLLVLGVAVSRRRPSVLGGATLALLASGGVLWLLYLGEARSLGESRHHARFVPRGEESGVFHSEQLERGLGAVFGETTPVPMLSLLRAVDHQVFHAEHGHLSYFRGEVSDRGHWDFYLVTGALKNPEGLVLLLLLGLVGLRRTGRGAVHEACLFGYTLTMLFVFSGAAVQLGFKYMLPAVPFLCVAASRVLAPGPDGRAGVVTRGEALLTAGLLAALSVALPLVFDEPDESGWRGTLPLVLGLAIAAWIAWRARGPGLVPLGLPVLALALWAGADSLSRHPHHLVYANGWAGGPDGGTWYSVVGDDWGQDTLLLGEWMAEQGVAEITYDYYGTGDPAAWGVRHRPSFLTDGKGRRPEGLFAVHVVMQRRLPALYAFLEELEPVAVLGHTIKVYDLPPADGGDPAG